jgi:hypothetical protein
MSDPLVAELVDCLNPNNAPIPLVTLGVQPDGAAASTTLAPDPTYTQSLYRAQAVNGDGQAASTGCVLVISTLPPPTVTDVVPPFAFAGVSGDGVLSDATVQVFGTGFNPSPSVRFDRTTGELVGWTVQSDGIPAGAATHGQDALLYFGFLYDMLGVASESDLDEPDPASGCFRFPFDEDAAAANAFLDQRQSAAARLSSPRAYYAFVRLNAKLLAFGGNDGAGATNAVDVNTQ